MYKEYLAARFQDLFDAIQDGEKSEALFDVKELCREVTGKEIDDEESKVEVCPQCGASCNDDVTIADHGCCYDCLKAQLNSQPDEEEL